MNIVDEVEVIDVDACMEEHMEVNDNHNVDQNVHEGIKARTNTTEDGERGSQSNADILHGEHDHGASTYADKENFGYTRRRRFRKLYRQDSTRRAREALDLERTAVDSRKTGIVCPVEPVLEIPFSSS